MIYKARNLLRNTSQDLKKIKEVIKKEVDTKINDINTKKDNKIFNQKK